MQRLVNIFDLDYTLIDSAHRSNSFGNYKFGVDYEYWITHLDMEYVMKDKLLPLSELLKEFSKTNFVNIAVTARKMYVADYEYLKRHDLVFHMILHREDSKELDHVIKEKKLTELFNSGEYIPFLAFDDKEENLKVFRSFGFKCFNALELNEKIAGKKLF